MSYTIDVYRNKLEPTKDFITFASFVSFFPQLVAGAIERATNLLTQFLGFNLIQNFAFYNLDVIVSLGHREKSKQRIQFRIWTKNTNFKTRNSQSVKNVEQ